MIYNLQIASLIIVSVIAINFFYYKRIRLLSTKIFEVIIVLCLLVNLNEIACIYCISNPEMLSISEVKVIHQLFYGGISFMYWLLYIYIDSKCRPIKSYSRAEFIIKFIPIAISIGMILFGNIIYHITQNGIYSSGSITIAPFISSILYCLLTLFSVARYRDLVNKLLSFDFVICMLVWVGSIGIQFMNPKLNFMVFTLTIICVLLYIIFENMYEYIDKDMQSVFSNSSFRKMLMESYVQNKKFWVINFTLKNADSIRSTQGHAACVRCIEKSIMTIPELKQHNVFKTIENSFGFIVYSEEELKTWYARYKIVDNTFIMIDDIIQPVFSVSAIECPTVAPNAAYLERLIIFANSYFDAQSDSSIKIIDAETAKKMDEYIAVEKILQTAIDEYGFDVFYQPIICAQTGRCVAAEALVRLKDDKTLGFISPEIFIPIAEQKGIIEKIDEIMFEKVCKYIKKYELCKDALQYIDVNISALQMVDPLLSYRIQQKVEDYGLSPSFFNLEVTETALLRYDKVVVDNMSKLKKLGYKFSMDDFGTGYSNFSNIGSLDYDSIKIDKSILWSVFDKTSSLPKSSLPYIISLLHAIGCKVVTEGVETSEHAEFLKEAGADFFQGYLYAKPMNEAAFIEYLRKEFPLKYF